MISFIPWLIAHGLDWRLFAADLVANRISVFCALDLVLTACVVAVFIRLECKCVKYARLAVPVMLLLGVSTALPLLLFLREKARQGVEVEATQ
jgi:hypothetical protein